jgi:hypothetical protein
MTDTMAARPMPAALRVVPWAVAAGLGLAGVALQSATFLNHDVAWVLWSSGRLLDGGVFGRAVVAANPPLIWWISELPMALSRLTEPTAVTCFYVFMGVILALSMAASDRLLRDVLTASQRAFFLGVAALILSLGAGRDFGQRENITVIAALPYILLVASRLRGEAHGWLFAAAVGASAAVGFAFKPHLLAVPILLEGALLLRLGFRRSLGRAELWAAVLTILAYIAAVFVFARPYLFEAMPAIAQVYWAFNVPETMALVTNTVPSVAALVLALLLVAREDWKLEPVVLVLAGAGFLIAAVLQWKAYSYHLYPVYVAGYLALAFLATSSRLPRILAAVVLTYFAVASVYSLKDRSVGGEMGDQRAQMIEFVNANTPAGGRFLAFSTHPFPGFPTALHVHANWAARSNSRLFMPAVARLSANPAGREEELAFAARHEHAAALADMTPLPDLVLIDVQPVRHAILDLPFDYLAFYREDPAFAAKWQNYEEIPRAPEGYRAFRLWRGARP